MGRRGLAHWSCSPAFDRSSVGFMYLPPTQFPSALAKKRVKMYCGGVFKMVKRIITPDIITEYTIYWALIKNKYI